MKKVTSLKDIAERVGVSIALVSYVLNGKDKEARVGATMAAKIKKVAKELDYQPNFIARSLKYGKTKTLGLIVADISNPFFSSLARIVENEAKERGYTVIFGSSDERLDKSKDLINAFINRKVDGIIIAPVENADEQIKELKNNGIPFVLIDRYFPKLDTNAVFIDNFDSSYNAVQHLVKNGYRKIGMVAYKSSLQHMKERVSGYEKCLKDNSLPQVRGSLIKIRFDEDVDHLENTLTKLIKEKKIDSLLFATVSLAVKSLHIIRQLKVNIPGELGLISFDESDAFDFFSSPLTYIKQDLEQIGKEAVSILSHAIDDQHIQSSKIQIPTSIIVKESSQKK